MAARVFLHGPPGVGKSTVAPLVAEALGVPAIDLDRLVAEREGASPAALLAERGEASFRAAEAAAIDAITTTHDAAVVALGGGALVDQRTRDVVARAGLLVTLGAPVDLLHARIQAAGGRPLLPGGDISELGRLVRGRAATYSTGHAFVPAASPPARVAEAIVRLARAPIARVHLPGAPYAARVVDDAAAATADATQVLAPSSVHLITDDTVFAVAGERFERALAPHLVSVVRVPPGEPAKRAAIFERVSLELAGAGADRGALLIALGGGSVSDLTGFVAASFMRGVAWIAVPTTTLAMADAALGGKTALDVGDVKNLVGAFHHPRAVLVEPRFGAHEPERQRRSGLAEIIKALVLQDADTFAAVERTGLDAPEDLRRALVAALDIKARIVSDDPGETGRRALLNLGHTFGHALEAEAGFGPLLHGEAIAIGMVAACRVSESLGFARQGLAQRVAGVLERAGLPTRADAALVEGACARLASDKKRRGKELVLVLMRDLGDPLLHACSVDACQRLFMAAAG